MRIVVMAAAAIGFLTLPAQAQQMVPGQQPWQTLPKMNNSATQDEEKPATTKPNEKAYKAALDSIAPKQAYDPWGNVREKPQSNNSR
jgi:hypothetical protein